MSGVSEGRKKQIQLPITRQLNLLGDTLVIPAPAPGRQIIVHQGSIINRAAAVSPLVSLKAGANPPKWVGRTPANGGAVYFDFGDTGWPLRPTLPLNANLSVAGDVQINITSWREEEV